MIKLNKLIDTEDKIFVAGHHGMVGKAIKKTRQFLSDYLNHYLLIHEDIKDFFLQIRARFVLVD